jgi:hypothetical protein
MAQYNSSLDDKRSIESGWERVVDIAQLRNFVDTVMKIRFHEGVNPLLHKPNDNKLASDEPD